MSRVKLTTVCNITTGKLDANAAEENGIYPFFTCAPEPLTINTYAFDDNVILLAGNNAAGNFHCQRYKGKFNAYQRTYVITAKEGYDIEYIYYNLKLNLQQLKKKAQGSQTKFLTMKILEDFMVDDIEYLEQKKITKVLSQIDNKINTNNCVNEKLEEIEKKIFDYWFLQFDFPDDTGKPYKFSGGEMVWNEKLGREIPEGWEVGNIAKVAEIVTTSITPQENIKYSHYSIPAFDEGKIPTCDDGKDINSNKYVVPQNAILVSKLNPQFKRIWAPSDVDDNSICSTEFMPFVGENREFLYEVLNSDGFYKFMVQSSSSSTGSRKRIQPDLCLNYIFAMPCNNDLIERFCKIIEPMIQKIDKAIKENQKLALLRDFLLPLLLNGQVEFKN